MWCLCWHRGGLGSSPDGGNTLWATHGETSLLLNYKNPGSLQDCKLSSTGGLSGSGGGTLPAIASVSNLAPEWYPPLTGTKPWGLWNLKGQQSQTRPQADTTRCRKSSGHSGSWGSPWCIKVRRQTLQQAGQAIRPTKQVLCSAPQELSSVELKSQDHMNCRHHFWGWGFQTFPWLQRLIFIVSTFSPSFNSLHFSPCPKWSPKLFSFEGPESSTPITLEGFSALPCPVSVAASTAGHYWPLQLPHTILPWFTYLSIPSSLSRFPLPVASVAFPWYHLSSLLSASSKPHNLICCYRLEPRNSCLNAVGADLQTFVTNCHPNTPDIPQTQPIPKQSDYLSQKTNSFSIPFILVKSQIHRPESSLTPPSHPRPILRHQELLILFLSRCLSPASRSPFLQATSILLG